MREKFRHKEDNIKNRKIQIKTAYPKGVVVVTSFSTEKYGDRVKVTIAYGNNKTIAYFSPSQASELAKQILKHVLELTSPKYVQKVIQEFIPKEKESKQVVVKKVVGEPNEFSERLTNLEKAVEELTNNLAKLIVKVDTLGRNLEEVIKAITSGKRKKGESKQ